MDKLVIEGRQKLSGSVEVSGSKNAALAIMSAALLGSSGSSTIHRVPDLRDVYTLSNLLRIVGAKVEFQHNTLKIDARGVSHFEAPYELVKKMRASIYVLGPLLSRFGEAKVSLPGGCAFGPRPVDLHIEAMKKLGASIDIEDGYIIAKAKDRYLHGNHIHFKITSVGATGNTLMAAALAKGTTKITNAAIEPEITALCEYLIQMGAKIAGVGSAELEIQGVDELHGIEFTNIFDRIEAGTLLAAGAITGGQITLKQADPNELESVLEKFKATGCDIKTTKDSVSLSAPKTLKATHVEARPYPEFPTDMQAQWIALMTQASGTSLITDHVYIERFNHVPELNRLGAGIAVDQNHANVMGPVQLSGAKVMSTDLRASASLVLAGLAAKGKTEVLRVYHLDRGYEKIEQKLSKLGAKIQREKYNEFE